MPATRTVRRKVPRVTVTVAEEVSAVDVDDLEHPELAANAAMSATAIDTIPTTRTTPDDFIEPRTRTRQETRRAIIDGTRRNTGTGLLT
jgi:hypothetical protein